MMGRSRVIAGLVLVCVVASAGAAVACSCMLPGAPCQAYFQADAVFVGRVESIATRETPLEGVPDRLVERRVVHVAIDRVGRGVQGAAVDLWTGLGGGDCGFAFTPGERYVIYAWRRADGVLTTGICSRTRLASEAAEDLALLAAVPARGSGARLSGTIKHWERDYASDKTTEYGGVADAHVVARGPAGTFSGMTDAEGRYAMSGLPVGRYEIEVMPPPRYSTLYLRRPFEIKDARACQEEDFGVHYASRVSGSIRDASGQPVSGVRVEIAPERSLERPLRLERVGAGPPVTDSLGHFDLEDVPPGRFAVGAGLTATMDQKVMYPRTLFPVVEVTGGKRIDLGELTLPAPLRRYELRGQAVDATGAPIAGASIVVWDSQFRQLTMDLKTGADGTFITPVFEGQSLRVHGFYDVSTAPLRQPRDEVRLPVSGPPAPVRLVLVVR